MPLLHIEAPVEPMARMRIITERPSMVGYFSAMTPLIASFSNINEGKLVVVIGLISV